MAKHFLKKCVVKAVEMEEEEELAGEGGGEGRETVWKMSAQSCNIQQNIT